MPTAEANGSRFYYEVHGKGSPLVIINGLGIDITDFRVLSEPLAKSHKVLVFDNRGAGRSDKPDEPYSIEQMSSDTAQIMQQAGFNHADIIGVSMGGRIALDLVLKHPEMVKKLVLTSTSARVIAARGVRPFILFKLLPRLPLFKGKYPQPYYAFKRQRAASKSYDCADRLSQINKPVLIAHGKADKIAPLVLAEEMHQGISGSVLKMFEGGHLFFMWREREGYLTAVSAFLSEQD